MCHLPLRLVKKSKSSEMERCSLYNLYIEKHNHNINKHANNQQKKTYETIIIAKGFLKKLAKKRSRLFTTIQLVKRLSEKGGKGLATRAWAGQA